MMITDAVRARAHELDACKSAAVVQLIVLIAVFITLPILLYAVVRAWEGERASAANDLRATEISLVAKAIAPALEQATPADAADLSKALARFAGKDLALRVFFRPPSTQASSGVFFIAGAPELGAEALKAETARLQTAAIFTRFIELCDEPGLREAAAVADRGRLTTVTRVRGANGCWGLVSVAGVPVAAAFWSHPALRITGFVYAALVVLALASAVRMLITLRRARRITRDFEEVPWLDAIGPPIPAAPMAPVIAPVIAEIAPRDAPKRADGPLDVNAPGLLDAAREAIDLSQILRSYLETERQSLGGARGRLVDDLQEAIVIRGRADFVSTILTELIGGPLRDGASAKVTLTVAEDETRRRALLTVALHGLSAASAEMGRLPMIKQFVAALGAVSAETREQTAVTVRVAFQA